MKVIHITTGDLDGIGLEITLKSLLELPLKQNIQFVLWRSSKTPSFLKPLLKKVYDKFKPLAQSTYKKSQSPLIDIRNDMHPAKWVKEVALTCIKDPLHEALVTAPLSKTSMQTTSEFSEFRGHTDLLKSITKMDVFMCFLGDHFNVVLLTDHMPLKNVKLHPDSLRKVLNLIIEKRSQLGFSQKPIGVLGLNPHAGEEGLLGKEEKLIHPILKELNQTHKGMFVGPLVPDVAFQSSFWDRYCCYVSIYHDQGLIPFKMTHKHNGIQLSLGLPFIRTSVDHGTAKDIFGKNKASNKSLLKAIQKTISLMD